MQPIFGPSLTAMVNASFRKLLVLWLSVFFALSVTLSMAQESAMACDMSMAGDMTKSDCASLPHKNAAQACLVKCVASPATSVLSGLTARLVSFSSSAFVMEQDSPLTGKVAPPDPPPPRSLA